MKYNSLTSINETYWSYRGLKYLMILLFVGYVPLRAVCQAFQDEKEGVFYSISGNGLHDTSFLFGTYHLVKSSYLDEKPGVMRAFRQSAGLVVEIVIDSSELPAANQKTLLHGRTLAGLLGQNFADSLDHELKGKLGVGIATFNAYKPMTVMVTLSMFHLMRDNQSLISKYSGSPLDLFFVESGRKFIKTITPLETMGQQMDLLFNGFSDERQASDLKKFIRNEKESLQLGNDLLAAWLSNDLNKLYRINEQVNALGGDGDDLLIGGRNRKWLEKLPSLLQQRSQFIAVGALHLAGPKGLVQQLRQMGYIVQPISL